MDARELVKFLDEYLDISEIEDESNNGLQVEAPGNVQKIGFSVDACMDVFQKAHKEKCELIITHHGLIWGGIKYVRGDVYKRIKFLSEKEIGLYAAHIPLDIHKEVGNNVQLAHLLEFDIVGDFCPDRNIKIGTLCRGDVEVYGLTRKIQEALGSCTLFKFGKDSCRRIGIVTGAGAFALDSAIEAGCDTFITGEARHSSYHKAEENAINIIFAGHYKTETLGVKALMEKIKEKFGLETVFIDAPTGL